MDGSSFLLGLAVFAFAYLLGSISFGVITTRFAGMADIRSVGSGNIGATNVLRTGRKGLAAATLLGDMLKGTLAVVVARHLDGGADLPLVAAVGAVIGHLFPVWLKFRGGKGVATYIGVLIGLAWPAAAAFCAIWLIVAFVSRYSSLAALIASAATPLMLWLIGQTPAAILFIALTALVWWRHHENIARLMNGTEGKIGKKADAAPAA
jgi:glycerol-3-phosphate acyltransferase PlsY